MYNETVDDLVVCIWKLAHCAEIGNKTDAAVDYEVLSWLMQAIPDIGTNFAKQSSRLIRTRVCHTYLKLAEPTIPSSMVQPPFGKSINAVHFHPQHQCKGKKKSTTGSCQDCTQ